MERVGERQGRLSRARVAASESGRRTSSISDVSLDAISNKTLQRCFAALNMTTTRYAGDKFSQARNLCHECTLELSRNTPGIGRGTKRTDLRSDLSAGDHSLSCHSERDAAWTQTLTRSQDSVRCRSARDSRGGTFARDQRFGSILCHNRRRRGFSLAPPPLRISGILFSWLWDSGERTTRYNRAGWPMRFSLNAAQSRLHARSGGRHAP